MANLQRLVTLELFICAVFLVQAEVSLETRFGASGHSVSLKGPMTCMLCLHHQVHACFATKEEQFSTLSIAQTLARMRLHRDTLSVNCAWQHSE
jgi:hypothetical protein